MQKKKNISSNLTVNPFLKKKKKYNKKKNVNQNICKYKRCITYISLIKLSEKEYN